MPLIPVLGRQVDSCEFEASLSTRASSRAGPKAAEKKNKNNNKITQQVQLALSTYACLPIPWITRSLKMVATSRKENESLLHQLSTVNISSARSQAWRSSTPSMLGFDWLHGQVLCS